MCNIIGQRLAAFEGTGSALRVPPLVWAALRG
jgi:hypothetical protein